MQLLWHIRLSGSWGRCPGCASLWYMPAARNRQQTACLQELHLQGAGCDPWRACFVSWGASLATGVACCMGVACIAFLLVLTRWSDLAAAEAGYTRFTTMRSQLRSQGLVLSYKAKRAHAPPANWPCKACHCRQVQAGLACTTEQHWNDITPRHSKTSVSLNLAERQGLGRARHKQDESCVLSLLHRAG